MTGASNFFRPNEPDRCSEAPKAPSTGGQRWLNRAFLPPTPKMVSVEVDTLSGVGIIRDPNRPRVERNRERHGASGHALSGVAFFDK
jgi:hypothetical protein